jgi:hypothetical protein
MQLVSTRRTVRHNLDEQRPVSWPVKLAEEDPLPCAQYRPALLDKQGLRTTNQAGLDMGGGIALQMTVTAVLGYHLIKLRHNIFNNRRVGVLVDGDSGCGMWNENVADAALHAAGLNRVTNSPGNILKVYLTPCPDAQSIQHGLSLIR